MALPREVAALRRGLELVPALRVVLSEGKGNDAIAAMLSGLDSCEDVVALIAQALEDEPSVDPQEGGVVRSGFSPELDELRAISRDVRRYLAELEAAERTRTGIRTLKVGYNRIFGYYIEVSRANLALVPSDYQRRQTLVGGERFVTEQLKEYESRILSARERIGELESGIFRQVCAQVAAEAKRLLALAGAVAAVDVHLALAEAASRYGYCRPEVVAEGDILVRDGRHPVVERTLAVAGAFVPNDVQLSAHDSQIIVLTGPNMAGKSTYLRQVALTVLLAQIGSFVPAASARIGLVDRIFTRVGAQEDIASGQSTFMVEMLETANILHNATPRSLVILDEIGRGTSTYDGMAIARAVIEYLHNRSDRAAKTLFATHYHELVALAQTLPRVKNCNVAVTEENGSIVFLHRIVPGGADKSYGIHVAELAGLPNAVVRRARDVLAALESQADGRRARGGRRPDAGQLPLMAPPSLLLGEIAGLEVDAMTPLEAITKLYELRGKARESGTAAGPSS
jgi:DNA mismatch repair protein MutS